MVFFFAPPTSRAQHLIAGARPRLTTHGHAARLADKRGSLLAELDVAPSHRDSDGGPTPGGDQLVERKQLPVKRRLRRAVVDHPLAGSAVSLSNPQRRRRIQPERRREHDREAAVIEVQRYLLSIRGAVGQEVPADRGAPSFSYRALQFYRSGEDIRRPNRGPINSYQPSHQSVQDG